MVAAPIPAERGTVGASGESDIKNGDGEAQEHLLPRGRGSSRGRCGLHTRAWLQEWKKRETMVFDRSLVSLIANPLRKLSEGSFSQFGTPAFYTI